MAYWVGWLEIGDDSTLYLKGSFCLVMQLVKEIVYLIIVYDEDCFVPLMLMLALVLEIERLLYRWYCPEG